MATITTRRRTSGTTTPGVSTLDRALTQMALGQTGEEGVQIFFTLLCYKPIRLRTDIATACIDATHQISANPDFIESLTPAQIRGVLVHELFHAVNQHFPRLQGRDLTRWNYATDAVINAQLQHMGYQLPKGVIHDPRGLTHSEEALYAELDADPASQPSQPEAGGDVIGGDLRPEGLPGDTPATPAEMAEAAQAFQQAFVRAVQQAERQRPGSTPGSLASLYDAIVKPTPVRWQDILATQLTRLATREPSWTRPNKRLRRIAYLPSLQPQPSLGHVTVVLDVSGSISADAIGEARGHILDLLAATPPTRLDLLTADVRLVQLDRDIDRDAPLPPTPITHGGTNLEAALRELDADDIPDVCLLLTDGQTPFTTAPWPDTTMLWAITTPGLTAPYGTTIPLTLGDAR